MIARGRIDVFEILAHNTSQWQGAISVSRRLMIEFPYSANPVNLGTIRVIPIKRCLIFVSKKGNNTTSNRYSHAEHIDEDKELILHHVSKGNEKEIFEHKK